MAAQEHTVLLRDLVPRGQIGVEVVLSIESTFFPVSMISAHSVRHLRLGHMAQPAHSPRGAIDATAQCQRSKQGEPHGLRVEYRQAPRDSGIEEGDPRVWEVFLQAAGRGRGIREELYGGFELDMQLEADGRPVLRLQAGVGADMCISEGKADAVAE